jgi:hypothetical protein
VLGGAHIVKTIFDMAAQASRKFFFSFLQNSKDRGRCLMGVLVGPISMLKSVLRKNVYQCLNNNNFN